MTFCLWKVLYNLLYSWARAHDCREYTNPLKTLISIIQEIILLIFKESFSKKWCFPLNHCFMKIIPPQPQITAMEHWLFCWEVQFRAKQASEHKNENKNENRRVPTSEFPWLFSENRQLKKAVLVFSRKNTLRASALQNEAQKQMALICTKMSYLWGLNFETFSKIKKVCLGASQNWLILSFSTGCFHSCKKRQNIFWNLALS